MLRQKQNPEESCGALRRNSLLGFMAIAILLQVVPIALMVAN